MKINYINSLSVNRWKGYRDFYLEAVKNEPLAFSETFAEAEKTKESEWKSELQDASKGKTILIFAECAGKLVGMGAGRFLKMAKMKHNAFLSTLYVDKAFRGKGIGRAITEKRINLIKKDPNVKNIFCEIIETQKASIELHKKLEFKVIGKLNNFFYANGKHYSEVFMQKQIRK